VKDGGSGGGCRGQHDNNNDNVEAQMRQLSLMWMMLQALTLLSSTIVNEEEDAAEYQLDEGTKH